MGLKKITMQDIADACGLSRNTVSKAFNGRGSVPESTKNNIFAKAREMGYYQYSPDNENESTKMIAVLTQQKLLSHNFGSYFITSFTDQISRHGYSIRMYEISQEEIAERKLPPYFDPEKTSGILGIELFDKKYIDMICSLEIPTVFVDAYPHAPNNLNHCDFLSMENIDSESTIVKRMIEAGAKSIGFVGDINHCNSFYERWVGFNEALYNAGFSVDQAQCILEEDGVQYGNTQWLLEQLDAMSKLPDAFACANDYLAIHLMAALKEKGLSVPDDIMLCGFDGSLEASMVVPSITTVEIPSDDIGRLAAFLLVERIRIPNLTRHSTYVKTTPIWGNSTL